MIPSDSDAVAIVPAAASGAALAGTRAVRALYYVFVLLIPIETINTLTTAASGFTFSKLLGLMLFGLALLDWRLCLRKVPAALWLIAWYIAVSALSQLWIPRFMDGLYLENQITMIQMAALLLVSANLLRDAEYRRVLLRLYGWWVALVALGMLLGGYVGEVKGTEGRITILGQDPNVSAAQFALAAVCIAGDPWIFKSRRFAGRFVMALAAVGVLILAILQTGSRGGLLVFLSGIGGLVLCGSRETRARRALIGGVLIGLLGFMIVREFQLGTTTATRLTGAWQDGDTAGRTKIYKVAEEMIREKPLLGFGSANNIYALGVRLNVYSDYYGSYYRDTHNLLLWVLTEVGCVGGVPFFAAILLALWTGWAHGRRTGDAVPFAMMCAQIVTNTSLTGLHQKMLWIVLGAAAACGMELDAGETAADREPPPSIQEAIGI